MSILKSLNSAIESVRDAIANIFNAAKNWFNRVIFILRRKAEGVLEEGVKSAPAVTSPSPSSKDKDDEGPVFDTKRGPFTIAFDKLAPIEPKVAANVSVAQGSNRRRPSWGSNPDAGLCVD